MNKRVLAIVAMISCLVAFVCVAYSSFFGGRRIDIRDTKTIQYLSEREELFDASQFEQWAMIQYDYSGYTRFERGSIDELMEPDDPLIICSITVYSEQRYDRIQYKAGWDRMHPVLSIDMNPAEMVRSVADLFAQRQSPRDNNVCHEYYVECLNIDVRLYVYTHQFPDVNLANSIFDAWLSVLQGLPDAS